MSNLMPNSHDKYFEKHKDNGIYRFITCGSVDDGKSTLIGRLLYDSKMIYKDQLLELKKESRKSNTFDNGLDFSLLVDGLASEREQGITIDVAYRFFSTDERKFIIADTPGHEQYTRNMVTGASTSDLAIVLIDSRKGVLRQTKRHSYIVSLLGIKNIIIAINKMDLVNFSKERFEQIRGEYEKIIPKLPYSSDTNFKYIPISALNGDNIVNLSEKTKWYKGKSLMEILNTSPNYRQKTDFFRMPIQYINRFGSNQRGYCGTIVGGDISVGDDVVLLPSNTSSKVKTIISSNHTKEIDKASTSMAITITLEDEIDISRGDIMVKNSDSLSIANLFVAMIVWMSKTPMILRKSYIIKRATTEVNGNFKSIEYKKDINTFDEIEVRQLGLNDIGKCTLALDKDMAADSYESNKHMGSFIVIDRHTKETVGAGMILSSLNEQFEEEKKREYTEFEIKLNQFIRKNYPEWNCEKIQKA